jgi:hemoglobin-like flavoprotein
LFRISAGTRNIFESRNINMDEQRKKLHEAAGALLNFRATDDPNPMSRYAVSHHAFALQPEHFAAFRDAFLAALSKRKPKVDSYAVDAWRAILDAAIAYMIAAATQHDRETRTRARRVTRERSIRLVQSA